MTCPFETVLERLVQHTLAYDHFIILCAILQKYKAPPLEFLSIEDICDVTCMNMRDAMKCIYKLIQYKFIVSYVRSTDDKKRVTVYGVDYLASLNHAHTLLNVILQRLEMTYDLFCDVCATPYIYADCINEAFETCCPNDKTQTHILREVQPQDAEKKCIQNLLKNIEALKSRLPSRPFRHLHCKRKELDSLTTSRVVARKS